MSLRCPACGENYADRWRCRCGTPLEFTDQPLPPTETPEDAAIDPRDGLWTFESFLPVGADPSDRVTLGEGYTPMVDAPEWDATFKLEYVFPTGSFKDRGATATLTRAKEIGADRIVEDSSGNAGAAIATYAARAGIDAEIYVPAGVKESKVKAIRRAGADVVRVEGTREDVTDACIDAVTDGEAWYASHAWNPAFFAGTATMAYEIAHQRDWSVPDAVVMPLGHGTMFLGAYRGFRALRDAGWTDQVPKLLGAQAAGYAPIAAELHGEDAVVGDNTVADGIQIRQPVQKASILDAIEATDGDAIALSKDAVASELKRLHRAGFYTEPTCAVAPAAAEVYRNRGVIGPDDDVVVPLSGSGLKG
ncbi:pyridoxal-phosphate dependent enzyme [Natronomonas gomsonensis]|uniref:pyridoxal-phosphate dependent enzyme n=1 Tax=Natronomonas gomsonensis TaxID=1046043 RepID=UPI0015BF9B9C|nr:pyridoxal-phosphate dependent enzyme [Natronomonas gomsonensis]